MVNFENVVETSWETGEDGLVSGEEGGENKEADVLPLESSADALLSYQDQEEEEQEEGPQDLHHTWRLRNTSHLKGCGKSSNVCAFIYIYIGISINVCIPQCLPLPLYQGNVSGGTIIIIPDFFRRVGG